MQKIRKDDTLNLIQIPKNISTELTLGYTVC